MTCRLFVEILVIRKHKVRLDRKVRSMVVYMARLRSSLDRGRVIMPFLQLVDVHFFELWHFGLEEGF